DRIGWTESAWDTAAAEHEPRRVIQKRKLIAEVPRKDWPAWAKVIALAKTKDEKGVGDTIARIVGPIGGQAYKRWREIKGAPCGCDERQADLNAAFPYK